MIFTIHGEDFTTQDIDSDLLCIWGMDGTLGALVGATTPGDLVGVWVGATTLGG